MAKIKVGELRKLQKELVEDIKTIEFNNLKIEIKQYLPIEEKIILASTIYKSCVDDEGEILAMNETTRDILTTYLITQYYTNLTLPQNYLEGYDLLVSTGLYDVIEESIIDEVNRVEEIVDNMAMKEIVEYEQKNRLRYVVKETLNELIEKIPTADEAKKFVEETSKEIENFEPEKLQFIQDFLKANSGEK
ncbi:MAG TPA: hypothetical protein VK982_14895 [Bacteroidales bacterium]|nr:hypothetical protein [Bacteroidales bacterium]